MFAGFVIGILTLDLAVFNDVASKETALADPNNIDFSLIAVMGITFEVVAGCVRLLLHRAEDFALVALDMGLVEAFFELLDQVCEGTVATLGAHTTKHDNGRLLSFSVIIIGDGVEVEPTNESHRYHLQ